MGYFTPPPCYKDNADCTQRHVGCRTDCVEWQKWQVIHEQEKEHKYSIYHRQHDVDQFEALQGNRIKHLDRARKAAEKRRR